MSKQAIQQVSGRGVHVLGDDIDTDRIIPARFMKCITFDGLGEYLFYDVRKDVSGADKPHNLNDARFREPASRQWQQLRLRQLPNTHAGDPSRWFQRRRKLRRDLLRNSTNLGVVCVTATDSDRETIAQAIEADPQVEITIDVDACTIRFSDQSVPCEIKANARESFFRNLIHSMNCSKALML